MEAVAAANDKAASMKNESNQIHHYTGLCIVVCLGSLIPLCAGPNGGAAKSPRFFQLYMGHDDDIVRRSEYASIHALMYEL